MERSLGLIAAVGMTVVVLLASGQTGSSGVQSREGFGGSLTVLNDSTQQSVAVNYRTWFIPPSATIDDLAVGPGNLVVEVASGALTTIIDSRSEARQFGEFFVVPAGHKLHIVTTNRSTILHILRVGQ